MAQNLPVGVKKNEGLAVYWDRKVSELAQVDVSPISPEQSERHLIYSLLTMALVRGYWNGNKYGAGGDYPWRVDQRRENGSYEGDKKWGDRYIGHNIACIAVDENGEIIDFDFNHNDLYNSSAEHAESRLVRRIFSLNQAYDHWQVLAESKIKDVSYGNVMNGVTIYTSLESCAQCSGVMTLGSCLRVVYLQSDPGQYLVGNLLYNLSRPHDQVHLMAKALRPVPRSKYWAPESVGAELFDFDYKGKLERAYKDFCDRGAVDPKLYFWSDGKVTKKSDSLTSFLCTDAARAIYDDAAREFTAFAPAHGKFKPARSDGEVDAVKSNAEAVDHARAFLRHALTEARRGTPHR